jgi:hypothetical protein
MVIEALKAARDFIENDRQALAESLTVNGEIVFEDDTDRRAMAEYVKVLAVIDKALRVAVRPDEHCEEHLDMVKERPAPAQPAWPLKEVDVLMMAEAHGIDPSTNGLYGFYIDCISNQPAAQPATAQPIIGSYLEKDNSQFKFSDYESDGVHHNKPAVPDAFGTREGEHPQYIQGWNDCRAEMLKGMKP